MKIAIEEWELYNNGILLCKWFDTEIDTIEEIEKYVSKVKSSNWNIFELAFIPTSLSKVNLKCLVSTPEIVSVPVNEKFGDIVAEVNIGHTITVCTFGILPTPLH